MPDWIIENPENIDSAEIIVGIPSRNEADSIAYPTEQASIGLVEYFRKRKSVIVNCDNYSFDGTKEAFFSAPCETPRIYLSTPPEVQGKGNNFKNLFKLARELEAKAVVVVDADLKSITPKWIKNLGEPLFDDFGFVAPLYLRHKYDGTITNNIAYPLARCLYGRRVRQPIGGDFGFSGDLARHYMEHETWNDEIGQFGIDIWMSTLAMYYRKPITQAFLGGPKIHRPKDPASSLGPMFRQVVGTIFRLMEPFSSFWLEVKWSKPTAIFGFGLGDTEQPPPVNVDVNGLYAKLKEGSENFQDKWKEALAPETYSKLQEVLQADMNSFELPIGLWAHVLFDMALAHRDRILPSEQLLNALAPLYYGQTLSFVKATDSMGLQQAEEYVEEQCLAFEEAKPYLTERWGS